MAGRAPSTQPGDVLLRDVTESDLPTFFEHQRDPEAKRIAAFPARDRDAFTAHWSKILGDESITKKTIPFDGRVAGNVVSFEQDGKLEVGYWIGREYRGKGVATKALLQFLGYVKERPSTLASPSTTSPPSGFWKSAASLSSARRTKNTS